jgi:hypothetical protein
MEAPIRAHLLLLPRDNANFLKWQGGDAGPNAGATHKTLTGRALNGRVSAGEAQLQPIAHYLKKLKQ